MNSYSGKNILITGGLGFIGSNLARALLSQGANVTLVDSLIPQYGGIIFNIHVEVARDPQGLSNSEKHSPQPVSRSHVIRK